MESEANNHSPFGLLPEGCIANIISFTTPRDACKLSLVSKIFRSAAKSDTVWERFLPSDSHSIISQSPSSSSLLASSSKKDLYFTLCDNPIIIDDGKKSFQLDRRSGKKCYMLASRDLFIGLGETAAKWTTLPDCRFEEVAELVEVCWIEIRGKISTHMLSLKTHYAVYLVFKIINDVCFADYLVEVSVGTFGGHWSAKNVCLNPIMGDVPKRYLGCQRYLGLQRPKERNDGWLEIEMGDFFNLGVEDDQVTMSVVEMEGGIFDWGFVLRGMEVRPKEDN